MRVIQLHPRADSDPQKRSSYLLQTVVEELQPTARTDRRHQPLPPGQGGGSTKRCPDTPTGHVRSDQHQLWSIDRRAQQLHKVAVRVKRQHLPLLFKLHLSVLRHRKHGDGDDGDVMM